MSDFSFSIWTWQTIILLVIGLWIFCLVDILKHQFPNNEKIIWLLVVLLVPMVGPFFYLLFGRKKRIKSA
ncbi:MAG: PLD nuclease N-terminal domain-containing protein [Maribacter sp.]